MHIDMLEEREREVEEYSLSELYETKYLSHNYTLLKQSSHKWDFFANSLGGIPISLEYPRPARGNPNCHS
jgi:hypothetical protein